MRIKTSNGTILESTNPLVTKQWKDQGLEDITAAENKESKNMRKTRKKA